MSRITISLRVLLALVLTLNGIGNAVASVRMTHAAAVEMTASDGPGMDCHGHDEAQARAVPFDEVFPALTEDERSQPDSNCCESGACQCACVHHAQAAVSLLPTIEAVGIHARTALPPKAGHSAPALPHLIRPPIG